MYAVDQHGRPASAHWAHAVAAGQLRHVRRNTTLFRQGEPSDRVAILLSGVVKVEHVSPDGQVSLLGVRGAGEIFGEMGVASDQPRSANVVAVHDSRVSVIAADVFLDMLAERGALAVDVLRQVVDRQREVQAARVDRDTCDVESRVARHLDRIHDLLDPPGCCDLSHEELAAWIGVSRPQVSSVLASLRDAGAIRTARRRVIVEDRRALAALA